MPGKSALFFVAVLFLILMGCADHPQVKYDNGITRALPSADLEGEFMNPPGYARVRAFWWWLNSNITKDCITRDLEAMKANGYGGAIIFDAGSSSYAVASKTDPGPPFLSEEWLELFRFAVSEADRLGLVLSINVQSGWNPGGPSVTPAHAMKKITWSDTTLAGPAKVTLELPTPPHKLLYNDLLVQAVRKLPVMEGDSAGIRDLRIKTLETRIGWSGIYPLNKLRSDFPGPGNGLRPEDVLDITPFMEEGVLTWDIPEGEWTLIRYGMTCTGVKVSTSSDGWDGLSMDHLNREALLQYDRDVISKLMETAKSAGNSLQFIHTDSWEMGVANWTDDYLEEFRSRRGYDPVPYLPVLTGRIVGARDLSNRFLRDFRLTVADLVAEDFYATFTQLAHDYGVYTHPESGGPHSAPIDAVRTMGNNDVPMGEFWVRSNTHRVADDQRLIVKQSASVAHLYGKQFVMAEGPTSIGPQWERPPKDCKNVIDRIFCSGVNRIVWHTYTASPDEYGRPGNEYFAGTHLNRHTTWWKEAEAFIRYMNRVSFMLSQGLFKADVLYYYGDDVPNFIFLKEEVKDLGMGYDWDKCSYDVLMDRISVRDGKILLPDGMTYSILVLPDETSIRVTLLRKLEKLVNQGMVLVGPRPKKATGLTDYPESDSEVLEIAQRLWGAETEESIDRIVGKGRVFSGVRPAEVLRLLGIEPDFSWSSPYEDTHLEYIHRSTPGEEIYFVVNRLARHGINDMKYRYLPDLPDRFEEVTAKFRITGKVPELWDPMSGKIERAVAYREENGFTEVLLHLPPEGSCFVVFRDKEAEKHIVRIEKDGDLLFPGNPGLPGMFPSFRLEVTENNLTNVVANSGTYKLTWSDQTVTELESLEKWSEKKVTSPWSLRFEESWGPRDTLIADKLAFWDSSTDDRVKYYSGRAFYSTMFSLTEEEIQDHQILLDIGNVQEIAYVRINGSDPVILWMPPFVTCITDLVKPGSNSLEVTVVNSWANRLIGDSYLPDNEKVTRTNVKKFEAPEKESLLRKSGLSGPVTLHFQKVIPLH